MTPPHADSPALRQAIIDACLQMNASGVNQGTSGNISVRIGDRLLITPSAIAYEAMTPDMLVTLPLEGDGPPAGDYPPSSEWRFHRALLAARPEMHAVVHAHPVHCTALAMNRMTIPACHYMVAAFGGDHVPLAGYARFGSAALADLVLAAMAGKSGCLMANHGAVVLGETLPRAMWRMEELETLAHGYAISLTVGTPVLLDAAEIDEALDAFAGYGLR